MEHLEFAIRHNLWYSGFNKKVGLTQMGLAHQSSAVCAASVKSIGETDVGWETNSSFYPATHVRYILSTISIRYQLSKN